MDLVWKAAFYVQVPTPYRLSEMDGVRANIDSFRDSFSNRSDFESIKSAVLGVLAKDEFWRQETYEYGCAKNDRIINIGIEYVLDGQEEVVGLRLSATLTKLMQSKSK